MESVTIPTLIRTPRDVKRTLDVFRALHSMMSNEVNWIDILGYSILLVKAPDVTTLIRDDPIFFASDFHSSEEAFIRHGIEVPEVDSQMISKLGDGWKNRPEGRLLKFLFPRFLEQDEKDVSKSFYEETDPKLISNFRALSFLVRQGLPPGAWPIVEIEPLFELDFQTLAEKLDHAVDAGRLNDLDYVLSYRYQDIKKSNHIQFWTGLAKWLRKPNDEKLLDLPPQALLFPQFMGSFQSALKSSSSLRSMGVKLIKTFIENGDVEFASRLLRDQIHAHQLFELASKDWTVKLGESEEMRSLILETAKLWRAKHLQSDWFFNNWNEGPVWFMNDAGIWDEKCRERIVEITSDSNSFLAFMLMVLGENRVIGQEGIEKIIGIEVYTKRLTSASNAISSYGGVRTEADAAVMKAVNHSWL